MNLLFYLMLSKIKFVIYIVTNSLIPPHTDQNINKGSAHSKLMPVSNYSRKSLEVQLDIALNALFKAIESGKIEDLHFALDIFNLGSIKNNPLIEATVVSFDGENYYEFNPFKAENLFCKQFLSGFAGQRAEL